MLNKPTDLLMKGAAILAVPMIALSFSACEVRQTEEGEMPDVDVEVDGGNVPEFDVETPEVNVEEREVEVPDTITVPDIDIVTPEEQRQSGNVEDTDTTAPATTPEDEEPATDTDM